MSALPLSPKVFFITRMFVVYTALYGLGEIMRAVIWRNVHAGLYENVRLMMNQIPDAGLDFLFWLPILVWYGQRRFRLGLILATIFLLFIFGAAAWEFANLNHYEISIYSGGIFLVVLALASQDFWIIGQKAGSPSRLCQKYGNNC
jgi:hypothetical protein